MLLDPDVATFERGSPRRCGGQGDITSGAAAILLHWALSTSTSTSEGSGGTASAASAVGSAGSTDGNALGAGAGGDYDGGGGGDDVDTATNGTWAVWAAAVLTKRCAAAAFAKHKRSTTAPDMLAEVGAVAQSMFPVDF